MTDKDDYEFLVKITPLEYHRTPSEAYLRLPMTQDEFIDALDRTRAADCGFECQIVSSKHPYLKDIDGSHLFELNYLAQRLASLDENESLFFEALCKMEETAPSTKRLINLTFNLNNCVIAPARDLEELGRFAVEGGFFPEFDSLPDEMLKYLDYEIIGKRFKEEQRGVFIDGIFIVNLANDNEIAEPYDGDESKICFKMREEFCITIDCVEKSGEKMPLKLPVYLCDLNSMAEWIGDGDKSGRKFTHIKSSIPKLNESLTGRESIYELNNLAEQLKALNDNGELPKYKAALELIGYTSLADFVGLAYDLNSYEFRPEITNEHDYGEWELLSEHKLDKNSPGMEYFNFAAFGRERMMEKGMKYTPYGFICKIGAAQEMTQHDNTDAGMKLA